MSDFVYISTGSETKMYTLRRVRYNPATKRVEDSYVRNLSTCKEKAQQRAFQFSDRYDVPVRGDAFFDLNKITRRNREEIEKEKARKEQQHKEQQERIDEYESYVEVAIGDKVMLAGKYAGISVEDVAKEDIKYIIWLALQDYDDIEIKHHNKFSISARIAKEYLDKARPSLPEYVGTVGERITIEVTLSEQFWTAGRFPTLLNRFVDSDGNEIVLFSQAKAFRALNEKDKITLDALVTKHSMYNGCKSTIVKKAKIIK